MKSEAVKVAQIQERTRYVELAKEILTHPVLLGVAGYYLSDVLQGDWADSDPEQMEGYVLIRRTWDPHAGKLKSGAAMAMQAGLTAYLGAEAVKSLAGLVR